MLTISGAGLRCDSRILAVIFHRITAQWHLGDGLRFEHVNYQEYNATDEAVQSKPWVAHKRLYREHVELHHPSSRTVCRLSAAAQHQFFGFQFATVRRLTQQHQEHDLKTPCLSLPLLFVGPFPARQPQWRRP